MTTLTVGLPNYGSWLGGDWSRLLDLARAAEDAGVDRVTVVDHVVMGPHTDAYAWGRFPTPPEAPWLEPLTVLTAMAAVTSRVRLGTGILVAPLRPAALLAKTVATLDVVSGGRVDLGVGVGWQREEYDALGLDFAQRGQLLTDTISACRALWSDLPATFTSATVSFADVYCAPQPVQPRLPVWFGGTLNERNLARITELGDGWIPIMNATRDDIADGVRRLTAARLHVASPHRVDVQSPVSYVRNEGGAPDIPGTMSCVPEKLEVGVSDVHVFLPAVCRDAADAGQALTDVALEFRKWTS